MMPLLHVVCVILTIPVVFYSDVIGHAWFVGKKPLLDKKLIVTLHRLVWVGLFGMVVTGVIMIADKSAEFFAKPAFQVKMACVIALIINSFVIEKVMAVATEKKYATLTTRERLFIMTSGAVSIVGWLGALLCAFLLAE